MTEPVRLQKLLSQCGICSRREAEDLIRKEKVTLNNEVATLGDRATIHDIITIYGKVVGLIPQTKKTIAWNKPLNVETTLAKSRDNSYKTLVDFDFGKERVFPIGRLDKHSRGLLLLTTDGELANRLMHPRYEKEKEYSVQVKKRNNRYNLQEMADQIAKGVLIEGKQTKPCSVDIIGANTLKIILQEGRNRQIRKMCEAVGYDVVDLFRVRFGSIHLEKLSLAEGEWKEVEISF